MEIAAIIGWLLLSIFCGVWADSKGRSGGGFFFLSLLLSPLVGFIAVAVAKPDEELIEQKKIHSGERKRCPFCAELIRIEAKVCRYCAKDLPEINAHRRKMANLTLSKKSQLIGGTVLLTLGILLLLDGQRILEIYISWPLVLVGIAMGLFLIRRQSLAGWIVGSVGVILFLVNFVIAFLHEVEKSIDVLWPLILIIFAGFLLYRYYSQRSLPMK